MAVVELEIPARPAYLSLVRLIVDAAVGSLAPGLSVARLDDLKIAVTEACSNAIEAHEAILAEGPVMVRCVIDDHQVTVDIQDPQLVDLPGTLVVARRGRIPLGPPASEVALVAVGEIVIGKGEVLRHVEGHRLPSVSVQGHIRRLRRVPRCLG